ncbi:DUF2254 domain-containing protein [Sphingomonas sp. CARO-RG-8B-R24-01]|uniref:DUF2254 domain-containing protein n=1 Tax=Sphingomonas sp. CARO-RG-8B-R24-01 TaxID=2914831 RepID=UPI001F571D44|nr:DUF2254 domain-containing protein [Sphingomonas sp. CARO-RG-8B-R24-01]
MKRWQWVIRLLTRRMWFRAALFCLFAVALALAGALIGHTISYDVATTIGAKSVDNILGILASSMLAVTTFSLSTMVSAYSGATSTLTPRAVQLLIDDSTAQNALATFLGSFLFAIVGIIALSTGIYGDTGRAILYIGTILVIVIIVVTFLRWIEHIARFGRVSDTIDRVERAATQAVRAMAQRPRFGPRARLVVPDGATTVRHDRIGRVTHIDASELATVAAELGATITLAALPGTLVDPARVLAWTMGTPDARQLGRIRAAFTVAHSRAFDHDPRFGLVVLSEIASRALSPAVNDPGTAIAVIEAGTRVLAALLRHDPDAVAATPAGIDMPPFAFPDLIEDLYRPIARDGAGVIEVGIRLQKSLAALQAIAIEATADCRAEAHDALARAELALTSAADQKRLVHIHDRFWPRGR